MKAIVSDMGNVILNYKWGRVYGNFKPHLKIGLRNVFKIKGLFDKN